jgi:hypothetical protein
VITRDIQKYLSRDWEAARKSKDEYWRERTAQLGPLESFRIAEELRRQALLQHPGWPQPSDRHTDILTHARLSELLRRASSAQPACRP